MKPVLPCVTLALILCAAGNSQPTAPAKLEFEAASIRAAAPQAGHFRTPGATRGGPGTADPTLFRCTGCDLGFLVATAFELQRYQFPGQSSLPDSTFDVSARIGEGTTPEQFGSMLQNFLKERFALTYHFETKLLQGYELVAAKSGPKLKESQAATGKPGTDSGDAHPGATAGAWHGAGSDGGHDHTRPGLMIFGGQARYRGEYQSMAELARMISNQLARPVDDHTGLTGRYDITLNWSDDGSHAATHAGGTGSGWEHGERGVAGGAAESAPGLSLAGALQAQLGLRLEARKASARIFVVDHIDRAPAEK